MVALIVAFALMQSAGSGIVTVARGTNSAIEERREAVARTAAEWQELWKSHGGSAAAPSVDFAKEMVAAVFLGIRPTGGYAVEITGVRRDGGRLMVEYVEHRPPADAFVTQALTSPFHIVRIPRHDGAVSFRSVSP